MRRIGQWRIRGRRSAMTRRRLRIVLGHVRSGENQERRNTGERERSKGLGLGLAIVQKIVVIHNGRVTFQPERDGGTRFTAILPLAEHLNP